jgi:hypothetical protein
VFFVIIESVPRGFPSGDLFFSWIPTGYKGVVQVASACHTEILEIPCLVLSQKMVLIVSFDKLLVELAQAAGPSLAALAWSCSFRNYTLGSKSVFSKAGVIPFFLFFKKVTANTLCRQVYVCS